MVSRVSTALGMDMHQLHMCAYRGKSSVTVLKKKYLKDLFPALALERLWSKLAYVQKLKYNTIL